MKSLRSKDRTNRLSVWNRIERTTLLILARLLFVRPISYRIDRSLLPTIDRQTVRMYTFSSVWDLAMVYVYLLIFVTKYHSIFPLFGIGLWVGSSSGFFLSYLMNDMILKDIYDAIVNSSSFLFQLNWVLIVLL